LLISFKHDDGQRRYIQIDAGKDFKEQVLRWFVPYKIPRLDAVRKGRSPLSDDSCSFTIFVVMQITLKFLKPRAILSVCVTPLHGYS
jgi:hypothetical protein